MTQDVDKLIERIQKLIALSASPNEHEAAFAANKVQELLGQHNLSMADIKAKGADEPVVHDDDFGSESRPWYRKVAHAAADLYFCEYYYAWHKEFTSERKCGYIRTDVHTFVGKPTNVKVAKMMFAYFVAVIKEAAKAGAEKQPRKERTKYITSFQWAAAVRLLNRVEDRIAQSKAGQAKDADGRNLPALLSVYEKAAADNNEYIKAMGNEMTVSHDPQAKFTSWAGALEGTKAAEDIGLDTQVEKTKPVARIGSK